MEVGKFDLEFIYRCQELSDYLKIKLLLNNPPISCPARDYRSWNNSRTRTECNHVEKILFVSGGEGRLIPRNEFLILSSKCKEDIFTMYKY